MSSATIIFARMVILLTTTVNGEDGLCTMPTGITTDGTGNSVSVAAVDDALSRFPYLWLPFAQQGIHAMIQHETPIQFRLAAAHGNRVYNAVAMFQRSALDIFGNDRNRLCQGTLTDQEYARYEQLTAVYAFVLSFVDLFPHLEAQFGGILDDLGFPFARVSDTPVDRTTPWGLAVVVINEYNVFMIDDGWNHNGSLRSAYNKMSYADFSFEDEDGNTHTPYTPSTYDLKKKKFGWQPLLETKGDGYFARQEHVTPYIGETARLLGVSNEEFMEWKAKSPESYGYTDDYKADAEAVLEATKTMATSELQKVMVEVFDGKFTSILPMQINWAISSGLSEFDFWLYDMALVSAMYDATVLVWREKIRFDRVRPTTVVHDIYKDELVETYAGPHQGVQQVRGQDWQPYIRTMPHGEYPSGSACICSTFVETLQQLTGSDDISGPGPITHTLAAGASIAEPGVTPASDVTLNYTKWSAIANDCGVSRTYGGMHFPGSVPAGVDLCTGNIAGAIVAKARKLESGDASGKLASNIGGPIKVRPLMDDGESEGKGKGKSKGKGKGRNSKGGRHSRQFNKGNATK